MLNDSKDDEVGYRKPPKYGRFQPGKSGNPRGRKRGSLNRKTLVNRLLQEKIEIQDNQRKRILTRREAIILGTMNKAVQGDLAAYRELKPDLNPENDFIGAVGTYHHDIGKATPGDGDTCVIPQASLRLAALDIFKCM